MVKFKKFLAAVTALSISASAIAGFTVSASADDVKGSISYADNKLTVTYTAGAEVALLTAKYNSGALSDLSVDKITIEADGTNEIAKELADGTKVFLWESLDSMKPVADTLVVGGGAAPTTAPTDAPTAAPTAAPTSVPREYTSIYTQDYEGVADTDDLKNMWASLSYAGGITLGTDHTKYAQYSDGSENTRTATSNFTVDLAEYDKYAVEFDLALTKSNKEDVQFVLASGSIPTANAQFSSKDYIFKISMAGTTNNCKINDVDAATVTLENAAWYHYTLLVDKKEALETVTITDASGNAVVDKLLVPTSGVNNKITGAFICSGRYNSVIKVDNIFVRTTDSLDVFGEKAKETLSKIEFTSQLNKTITQPAEGEPVHEPITVKATGIYGGDLTNEEGLEVKWTVTGLDNEDGYISLTKEEGTELGTVGGNPDGSPTAYFNVRNGVSNWFGSVTATVTYLDKELSIVTPFAVIGASGSSSNLAPKDGYPVEMNTYDDALVGYKATSDGVSSQDLVLNSWSIYGSNGSRTLTLNKDEGGTKYLRFASNGGSGSTVAVYQLAEQATQYIVDMKVRFTGGKMTFGHYFNTPNNTGNDPNWTCSYESGALKLGTQSIDGVDSENWFRVVVSADESAGTCWAKVYKDDGTLLGETDAEALLSTANATQKYFCFMGDFPVDLASFKIYYPTAASLTINAPETIAVPEKGEAASVTDLAAVLKDTDGWNMSGQVAWTLDEEYAGVTLGEDGKLTVTDEAGSGTITVTASYGSTRTDASILLSTSGNSLAFTSSTSSVTIPFAGEEDVVNTFAAEARNKNGEKIDSTVTYDMVNASGETITTIKGVTFDAVTGKLTVAAGAAAKTVYIKASSTVDGETLTSRAKVSIHGLSFAFGSDAPADESFTQVTNADAYTAKLGYGFADTSAVTTEAGDVKGTAAYTFKAKVPNGNYVVNVTTSAESVTSEVVESVSASTGIGKTGSSFSVAVCDEVLDLTFPTDSTLTSIAITQAAAKTALSKPAVYAIGDSTTNNTGNGAMSWGNYASSNKATLMGTTFSDFSNNGMAGRDSVNFYNQGRVESVLLAVCPGDYVTVNMGINSKETNEGASYETLMSKYYVDGIIQRGAIPVIVTATPDGPVGNNLAGDYDAATGKFTNNRGNGARNDVLRKIAKEKSLNLIELGQAGEDWLNASTLDELKAYGGDTTAADKITLVQSWYVDHNHYKEPMAKWISEYMFATLNEIVADPTKYVPVSEE